MRIVMGSSRDAVTFDSLNIGDVFTIDRLLHLKINTVINVINNQINAINLTNFNGVSVLPKHLVIPYQATLLVE